ncbi:MAG: TIGR03986 family CRISPR-associated RAMP protein [Bacillota bacterium]
MSEQMILSWPKHRNPERNRTASAPYNFVPLPEVVVTAVDSAKDLPVHDRYDPDKYTGYFEVTLATKSPLYVRCPFTLEEFLRQERGDDEKLPFRQQVKNTPHFFYTRDPDRPVIPGSSLRGMLRSLLEVVSYGKVQWVTERQLFFRTVDDTAVGKYYNRRMVEELGNLHVPPNPPAPGYRARVEGGFFRIRPNGKYSIEECDVARVEINELLSVFGLSHRRELYELDGRDLNSNNERNPNQTPKWIYQHRDIWAAEVDSDEKDYFFPEKRRSNGRLRHPDLYLRFRRAKNVSITPGPEKVRGTLVLTGHMESKHLAFMFIPKKNPNNIEVPNDPGEEDINKRLVDRFHDDDQITQWQMSAFPHGQPAGAYRSRDGYLRDGEPVFFLRENGKLTFFGRAQMFRLPYISRPLDLVPAKLRRPEDVDYAEALFGFVRTRKELEDMKQRGVIQEIPKQGDKRRAYAGRVFVTDAVLEEGQTDIWLSDDAIVPKILASPKPTAFQHYLVQTNSEKSKLRHYDGKTPEEKTVIRGHKRYWLQGERSIEDIREDGEIPENSTQHTQFKPVKPGVKFRFRIYFKNLSERELGALCWVLHPLGDPKKEYCHQLGMGKPLGMGAVKLEATLHLTDRTKRYSSLFDGSNWQTGLSGSAELLSNRITLEQRTRKFEEHILGRLNLNKPCNHLYKLKRIAMLLKMMEWPGYPPVPSDPLFLHKEGRPNTRYMELKEFRDRPVLPAPSAFGQLTGDIEPMQPTISGTNSLKGRKVPSSAVSVESIQELIEGLRGAGEVSRVPEIVGQIEKLSDPVERGGCAKMLQQWLRKHKLWNKGPHASTEWHRQIERWLKG